MPQLSDNKREDRVIWDTDLSYSNFISRMRALTDEILRGLNHKYNKSTCQQSILVLGCRATSTSGNPLDESGLPMNFVESPPKVSTQ